MARAGDSLIGAGVVFLIVAAVAFILVGPFITIWSLNTLFDLEIAYTFWTWLAMAWFAAVFAANTSRSSSK